MAEASSGTVQVRVQVAGRHCKHLAAGLILTLCVSGHWSAVLNVSGMACRLSSSVLQCIFKQLVQQRVRHGGDVKRKLRVVTARCPVSHAACFNAGRTRRASCVACQHRTKCMCTSHTYITYTTEGRLLVFLVDGHTLSSHVWCSPAAVWHHARQLVDCAQPRCGACISSPEPCACRYCKGVDFLQLCCEVEVPACLLLRRLLEELCEGTGRKASPQLPLQPRPAQVHQRRL